MNETKFAEGLSDAFLLKQSKQEFASKNKFWLFDFWLVKCWSSFETEFYLDLGRFVCVDSARIIFFQLTFRFGFCDFKQKGRIKNFLLQNCKYQNFKIPVLKNLTELPEKIFFTL